MLTIGPKLRLSDSVECGHVRESLERTHRYVAASPPSPLCGSQHAGCCWEGQRKGTKSTITLLSHAISAPHPPPPREMLYADLKVVSGVYEVEVRSLLAHSTWWKALEGDPLKPPAQGRAREQMRFNVHTPLLLHQMIHFV